MVYLFSCHSHERLNIVPVQVLNETKTLVSMEKFEELRGKGIEAIRDIPDDYKLNPTQKRVRKVWLDDEPYISSNMSEALEELSHPAYYLDFETMIEAI